MKMAIASDEKTYLIDFVEACLRDRGYEVTLFGPLAGVNLPWTLPTIAQLQDIEARHVPQ